MPKFPPSDFTPAYDDMSEELIERLANSLMKKYSPKRLEHLLSKMSPKDSLFKVFSRAVTKYANEVPDHIKNMLNNTGSVALRKLAVPSAIATGVILGRTLGRTPLLTDSNMTYDQFYQGMFENMLRKRAIKSSKDLKTPVVTTEE